MVNSTTEILGADQAGLGRATELLGRGELVAFPTETVYGLGADARSDDAVLAIYAAKGRPAHNPLIVHVASADQAATYVEFSPLAERLARAFWPGPLTLVLPMRAQAGLSRHVSAGLPTVAIRVPGNDLALELLSGFGGPVGAPSANLSGRISPTTAGHVLDGLDGRIAAVVDGGACQIGLESTIVGFDPGPCLLRPGGLPGEAIEAALGQPLRAAPQAPDAPSAPGQLASHYAPSAALRLNATHVHRGEVMLGFASISGDLNLSPSGDLREAAATLFDHLRTLDAGGAARIAVAPIPMKGLGVAINDRLRRAVAPRA